ncbi:MAG: hypothetical protein QY323_02865 [Patescibacteria group bacterium]|nr:MAG: hypothetical protein QY323_02865 [Patescibacteria group bacterium]
MDDPIFQAPPRTSPDEAHAGSGRRKVIWVIVLATLAIVGYVVIRSALSSDPSVAATKAAAAKSDAVEAPGPQDQVLLANGIYCADHANDPEIFPRWYCTEFRVQAERTEERLGKLEAREAPSNTALWTVIVILGILQIFTWATIAKKKTSDS